MSVQLETTECVILKSKSRSTMSSLLIAAVLSSVMISASAGLTPVPAVYPSLAVAPFAAASSPEIVDAHPQYSFAYDVQDVLTGDSKTQEETRDGDVVRGSYSLIEPDGSRRIVNYYADSLNGFNAVVQKDVPVSAVSPVVAKTVAAPIVAAPAPVVTAPAVVKGFATPIVV